jgi:uncharacterized protein
MDKLRPDRGRKTNSTSRGKAYPPRQPAGRHLKKSSPFTRRGRTGFPSLPVLGLWLLAVVILVGLIYWGESTQKSHLAMGSLRPTDVRTGESDRPEPHAPPREDSLQPDPAAGGNTPSQANTSSAPVHKLLPTPKREGTFTPSPRKDLSQEKASATPANPDRNVPLALLSLPGQQPKAPQSQPPATPFLGPTKVRIAIVIDDLGGDLDMARKFLALPFPVTFSVLPFLRHSTEVAELAHSHGREVMLHLPMEPHGYPKANPGQGALLLSMSGGEVQSSVRSAIDASPYIRGINNHMGSKFTENPAMMRLVLAEIQRRDLYFLDSRTSDQSVSVSIAQELRVAHTQRDIFLDHSAKENAVRSQMERFIGLARIRGTAVAIGHPHEITWKVLSQIGPRLREEHISVVPASALVVSGN